MKQWLMVLFVILSSSVPFALAADPGLDARQLGEETTWFKEKDQASGAVWQWQPKKASCLVHEPYKNDKDVVLCLWPEIGLPKGRPIRFQCEAKILFEGSNGVGISLLVREKGRVIELARQVIPGDRKIHPMKVDLSQYAGKDVALQLQVDDNGNTAYDSAEIIRPGLVYGAGKTETKLWEMASQCRTGVLESVLIDAMKLTPIKSGHNTAMTLPKGDSINLGAGSSWVLSREGLLAARDLQRRFPGVNIVVSANWLPHKLSKGRRAFLDALRRAGIYYQMQHCGLRWLNTQKGLSRDELAKTDGLVRNWKGEQITK